MQQKQDLAGTRGTTRATNLLSALIVVLLIAVAALITLNRHSDRATDEQARALTETLDRALTRVEATPTLRLAVLPLRNRSNDPDLDYLATGVAEEIRDQLSGVAGLRLIGGESSGNVASQELSVAGTARLLGANHLLQGSVGGDERGLTIELELYVVDDGERLAWRDVWSGAIDALPVTTQAVAAHIIETLLPGATTVVNRAQPSGAALKEFLLGKYLIDRYNHSEVLAGLAYFDRAIAADPQFERAYAAKISGHQRMTWIDAQNTVEHEVAVDSTIDRYLALGAVTPLTFRLRALRASVDHRPLEAFAEFQRAVQLAPQEYAYDRGFMIDLCKAGYLQRCLEQAKGLARADPVSAAAHSGMASVYLLLGEYELMLEHARLSGRFGGDLAQFYEAEALLRRGEFESAGAVLTAAIQTVGVTADWVEPYIEARRDPANNTAAIMVMQSVDANSAIWFDLFYAQFVAIDELDLAFAAVTELIAQRFETWNLWLWEAQMAPFRNDPRFIDVMEQLGLTSVWRSLGLPDVCVGPAPEPFCADVVPHN